MDLFPLPESLSPMEAWRQRHDVGIYRTLDGWKASTPRKTAHGKTQEEALLAWADAANVPCWKSEELAAAGRGKTNPQPELDLQQPHQIPLPL